MNDYTFADVAMSAMQAEIKRLQRWKADATSVLNRWDAAYECAEITGRLGDYKPDLMLAEIKRLRAALSTTTPGAGTGSPTGNNQPTHKEQ